MGGTAQRLADRGRDPRLILGAVLVIGSALLGAFLLRGDDEQSYWVLAREVAEGDEVRRADLRLEAMDLHGTSATLHLSSDDEFPAQLDDLVWARDLGPGELVSTGSFVSAASLATVEVPLQSAWGRAPDDLAAGDRVDVWVGAEGVASLALAGVPVAAVGEGPATSGATTRTVVVRVDRDALRPEIIAALGAGDITVVRTR